MPILSNYTQFDGRDWETGSVHNVLAYQSSKDESPLSEAMLMGISGGAAFGYFVFDYAGTDPHVALLSRNTFDPLDTLLERLAIPQDLYQTASPEKGKQNLIDVLESGRPALVWADAFGLRYNAYPPEEAMWAMLPIVVYGYDGDTVHIADRSTRPLIVAADELAKARARVKKDKYRVLALGTLDRKKLLGAIQKGIWQCIGLYTEAPPKGARDNFGFAAYEKWAKMLTNTRNKQSWERLLAPGRRMHAALAGFGYQPGAFGWARTYPSNQVDDRQMYADFLDEAAPILAKPKLKDASKEFRASSTAWGELADALLPDDVPLFKENRDLLLSKSALFINDGDAAREEIQEINNRLGEIRTSVAEDFPMSAAQVVAMREQLAELVLKVSDIERQAIDLLQSAME